MILMAAQDDDLFEIDFVVRKFQEVLMRMKYCKSLFRRSAFPNDSWWGSGDCFIGI